VGTTVPGLTAALFSSSLHVRYYRTAQLQYTQHCPIVRKPKCCMREQWIE
jgi:hypothetical protein